MKIERGFVNKWWVLVVLIAFVVAGSGLVGRLLSLPVNKKIDGKRPALPDSMTERQTEVSEGEIKEHKMNRTGNTDFLDADFEVCGFYRGI